MAEKLIFECAADIEPEPVADLLREIVHMPGSMAIAQAIAESEFADSHPDSKTIICWRFCMDAMPAWLAVLGIRHGYSSPSEWRHAHGHHRRLGIRRSDFVTPRH